MKKLALVATTLILLSCSGPTVPSKEAQFIYPHDGDIFALGSIVRIEIVMSGMAAVSIEADQIAGGSRGEKGPMNVNCHTGEFTIWSIDPGVYEPGAAYELSIKAAGWSCGKVNTTGTYDAIRVFIVEK